MTHRAAAAELELLDTADADLRALAAKRGGLDRVRALVTRLAAEREEAYRRYNEALSALEIDNPITRCLAPLLDLPEPKTQLAAI